MSAPVTVKVNFGDKDVGPKLAGFIAGLTNLQPLNASVGNRAMALVKEHLRQIALTRHATAERLGAQPTGHWAQAVEKTSMVATAEGATVTISQAGIGRAAHDVDITPGAGKKYLTIANLAAGYGQRAYRMALKVVFGRKGPWALVPEDYKPPKGATGTALVQDVKAHALYILVKAVHQKQDPTLIPTSAEIVKAAVQGALDYVQLLIQRKGGATTTT